MSENQQMSYRWCLYILILIVGYWIGLSKAEKPGWFYIGPDQDKAKQAWISITLKP